MTKSHWRRVCVAAPWHCALLLLAVASAAAADYPNRPRHITVPFAAGGSTDVLAGQVQVMVTNVCAITPHGRAGRLRMLGVTTAKRGGIIPEIPTLAKTGLPGYESIAWYGLVAPAGLPPAVLGKLSSEVIKGTRSKDMHDALIKQGAETVGNGPKEFATFIKSETAKYSRVIRDAGIRAE